MPTVRQTPAQKTAAAAKTPAEPQTPDTVVDEAQTTVEDQLKAAQARNAQLEEQVEQAGTTSAEEDRDLIARENADLRAKIAQLQAAGVGQAGVPILAMNTPIEVTERDRAINALMSDRDHLRECPVGEHGADPRPEIYGATKPANPSQAIPAKDVTVVRCITCGGSTILDKPIAESLADVAA